MRHTFMIGVLSMSATIAYPMANAKAAAYACVPIEVAELDNRIHVLCAEPRDIRNGYPQDGSARIRYFAVAKSHAARARRFAYLAHTALTSGHMLLLSYTSGDKSGTSFGCAANDCRTPWAIALLSSEGARVPLN